MVCGARRGTGGQKEHSIKVSDTDESRYGLTLFSNAAEVVNSIYFLNRAFSYLNIDFYKKGNYTVLKNQESITALESGEGSYGYCDSEFSIFDINNGTIPNSQKKPNPAYIHELKFYGNDEQLLRHYKAQLVDGVPSLLEVTTNTTMNIIGTAPIYYFTDETDIKTYNP